MAPPFPPGHTLTLTTPGGASTVVLAEARVLRLVWTIPLSNHLTLEAFLFGCTKPFSDTCYLVRAWKDWHEESPSCS